MLQVLDVSQVTGPILLQRRTQAKLSLRDLERATDGKVKACTICQIENGTRGKRMSLLIAQALDVALSERGA